MRVDEATIERRPGDEVGPVATREVLGWEMSIALYPVGDFRVDRGLASVIGGRCFASASGGWPGAIEGRALLVAQRATQCAWLARFREPLEDFRARFRVLGGVDLECIVDFKGIADDGVVWQLFCPKTLFRGFIGRFARSVRYHRYVLRDIPIGGTLRTQELPHGTLETARR